VIKNAKRSSETAAEGLQGDPVGPRASCLKCPKKWTDCPKGDYLEAVPPREAILEDDDKDKKDAASPLQP
jgi:hypothetical protein